MEKNERKKMGEGQGKKINDRGEEENGKGTNRTKRRRQNESHLSHLSWNKNLRKQKEKKNGEHLNLGLVVFLFLKE